MAFIKINNQNINYIQEGKKNGKEIIFLHGWGQNIAMMKPLSNLLLEDYHITIIDFPGFGESEEPKKEFTIYDYEEILSELINKLKIKNPSLFGHSFGGRVAIIYAAKNKVHKLMLTGSAGIKPELGTLTKIKYNFYKTAKLIFKIPGLSTLEDKVKSKMGSRDYKSISPNMRQTFVNVINEDLQYLFPKIKVPTLLFWGSNDQETPITDGEIMEAKMPDAALIKFEGGSHYTYLEEKNRINDIIRNFLGEEK